MKLTIDQLRQFSTCPLLLEQYTSYQRETLVSRSLKEGVMSIVYNTLYQKMRGRKPSQKTITESWKTTTNQIQQRFPNIKREDFDFPAQCIAIFLEYYLDKTNEEIVGIDVPFDLNFGNTTIHDTFHILSKNPFGTRITLFDMDWKTRPTLWMENDPILSTYIIAYNKEYQQPILNLTMHNLGDGTITELIKKPVSINDHEKRLALICDLCYNKYSFPNDQYCSQCKISISCHNKRYHE